MNRVTCPICKEVKKVMLISNKGRFSQDSPHFRKAVHTLECNHKYIEELCKTYTEAIERRKKIRNKGEWCSYIYKNRPFNYYWFGHTGIPA